MQANPGNMTPPSKDQSKIGKRKVELKWIAKWFLLFIPFNNNTPLPPTPSLCSSTDRGCTDIVCCILFILAILGYFAVGILGKWYTTRGGTQRMCLFDVCVPSQKYSNARLGHKWQCLYRTICLNWVGPEFESNMWTFFHHSLLLACRHTFQKPYKYAL